MIDLRVGRMDLSAFPAAIDMVVADPPWPYENAGGKQNGGAEHQYGVMRIDQIVHDLDRLFDSAAPDSYMAVWCTWPKIVEFCSSAGAMRWRHLTGAAWNKNDRPGTGWHMSGDSEPMLLFAKGSPKPRIRLSNGWSTKRYGHSVKPRVALEELVLLGTDPGGLVADPYAGASASLALTCRRLGRHYVGWELSTRRHAEAREHLAQGELFPTGRPDGQVE